MFSAKLGLSQGDRVKLKLELSPAEKEKLAPKPKPKAPGRPKTSLDSLRPEQLGTYPMRLVPVDTPAGATAPGPVAAEGK